MTLETRLETENFSRRYIQIEPSGKSNIISLVPEAGYTFQTNSTAYIKFRRNVATPLDIITGDQSSLTCNQLHFP